MAKTSSIEKNNRRRKLADDVATWAHLGRGPPSKAAIGHGETIVFTNGCYDVLQGGHISCLNFCREHGEVTVIGLNSDVSVRKLKGPQHPVNTQNDRAAVLAALRRDTVAKPVVYVGAGTCGLGAGAGKTLAAIREWIAAHKSDAQIVETGCIGLCSEEPIVDFQLPGRARVSFGGVTAEKVPDLLAAMLGKGAIPAGDGVLGQFRAGGAKAWDGVPELEAHSFLRPQYRVVLAASGIIDPSSIDEYAQILAQPVLSDHLVQSARAQCGIDHHLLGAALR